MPLLDAQKTIYNFGKLKSRKPETTTYHYPVAMTISGHLDEEKFTTALNILVSRHEILRSKIVEKNSDVHFEVQQLLQPSKPFKIIKARLKVDPPLEDLVETLKALKHESILDAPFDFQKDFLWRGALLKFSDDKYQLVFVFHQIMIDVNSLNILFEDFSEIYNALTENKLVELSAAKPINNLTLKPASISAQNKTAYWQNQLEDLNIFGLHHDYPATDKFNFAGDRVNFEINANIFEQLEVIAKRYDYHLNVVLLAGVYALLYRHFTAEKDICLGLTYSTRGNFNEDTTRLVNCFINIIPLRVSIDKNIRFTEFISKVALNFNQALANQLPLDSIIVAAANKNIKPPLYNIICHFHAAIKPLAFSDAECGTPKELNFHRVKVQNFTINFSEKNGYIEYNSQLFSKKTIENFIQHLTNLYTAVAANLNYTIPQIPILTEAEKSLLTTMHQKKREIPDNVFFHHIFDRAAEANWYKDAIVFHGLNGAETKIKFSELHKRTDELAALLIQIGVGPEKTVGVCIKRSIELLIAMIAIWKAGGAVVPLVTDGKQQALLAYVTSQTMVSLVLVDNHTEQLFSRTQRIYTLNIANNSYIQKTVKQLNASYVAPVIKSNNLAYIVYTSGTTGEPKGVMIEHGGFINVAYEIKERNYPKGNIYSLAPATFDPFFWDILVWLITEGEFHLSSDEERMLPAVQKEVIKKSKISFATFTPDMLKNLNPKELPSLKHVISMGAAPHPGVSKKWIEAGVIWVNEYGPSEGPMVATRNNCDPEKSDMNVGRPICNLDIFILDENFRECPIGTLYIASTGLARGYVGNNAATKEKFVFMDYDATNHVFYPAELQPENSHRHKKIKSDSNENTNFVRMRLYNTQDIARYTDNGEIELFGRADRQVKIHCVRIELDGVQELIRKHKLIKDVFVTVNETKTALIAYVVSDFKITKSDLNKYLKQTAIPSVAWPKFVEQVKQIPLNKNGKVDAKALPVPTASQEANIVIGSQNPFQAKLCEIWSEVLGGPIDIRSTFSDHGGNSQDLITLETKLNEVFSLPPTATLAILNEDLTIIELERLLNKYLYPEQKKVSQNTSLSTSGTSLFKSGKTSSLSVSPFGNCFRLKQ